MNAFVSFDLFMVYIPECKQQLRFDLIFGVLTPLSAIFQLYHGNQL